MNNLVKLTLGTLLLLGVATAGYWFGMHTASGAKESTVAAKAERKVLYYRNPMGLADTSPVPKKDSMGMDYVPVYEGEEVATGQLSISTDKVQKLGVKSEAATLRELDRTLRVTGRIEVNERRTYAISPKFEGWVERLYVNTTGQTVGKGQPLFEVYSPELVSAQGEYALALQGLAALKDADAEAKAGMQQLADASRCTPQELGHRGHAILPRCRQLARDFPRARSPASCWKRRPYRVCVSCRARRCTRSPIFPRCGSSPRSTNRTSGRCISAVRAQVTVDAWPDRMFDGKVDFIYPTLNSATRTVQVRIELSNPKGVLKPAMFANVQIAVGNSGKVLTVPTSAVIDSGSRQLVLVRLAEGRFEPRTVSLGNRSDNYVEVLGGIVEGEQVVTSANFLLDSESNLKTALSGMNAGVAPSASAASAVQPEHKSVGHQAQGTLDAINEDGTVSITHEPIKSLGWPGMTMDFALANSSLAAGIKPGSAISFEIVERTPGEWVITRLQAQHGGH